jgi:dTDP-4-amino-4,6-dideoxygalactose transaminase
MTFDATLNPVVYEGGEPIFIDTERDSWNMDPVALEKAFEMYPDVKLVISAELYGFPGRMDEIKRICEKHGALLIEDAAEAMGASILCRCGEGDQVDQCGSGEGDQVDQCGSGEEEKCDSDGQCGCGEGDQVDQCGSGEEEKCGDDHSEVREERQCGSFGDYAAISYNGNKIITGSAGGCLLCSDLEDANKARKWSTQSREAAPWYQHEEVGYNYRMSNVIAGVVRGQYGYLEEHIRDKKRIYERYAEGLKGLPVSMNPITPGTQPNYWLSCLLIDRDAMCKQVRGESEALYVAESGKSCPTEILEALSGINAEGRPIWKPMHMQPMYRMHEVVGRSGSLRCRTNAYISEGELVDVGADIFNRGVCLPSDNKMTAEEQGVVIEVIRKCFE